jgi:AbrB family looped-hinge helix DNA binding protein
MKGHVSSKGQIVLPAKLRRQHHLGPGTEVEFEEVPGGVMVRFLRPPGTTTVDELLGCAGYAGPRRSLADMERAIAVGATAERRR